MIIIHASNDIFSDDLRRLISVEKVCPKTDRSTAEIVDGRVKLTKKVGKWNHLSAGNILEFHEALYLIEMVRKIKIIKQIKKTKSLFPESLRSTHKLSDIIS